MLCAGTNELRAACSVPLLGPSWAQPGPPQGSQTPRVTTAPQELWALRRAECVYLVTLLLNTFAAFPTL